MARLKLKEGQNINLHALYNKNKMDRIMGMFICDTEQQIFRKTYYISNFLQSNAFRNSDFIDCKTTGEIQCLFNKNYKATSTGKIPHRANQC